MTHLGQTVMVGTLHCAPLSRGGEYQELEGISLSTKSPDESTTNISERKIMSDKRKTKYLQSGDTQTGQYLEAFSGDKMKTNPDDSRKTSFTFSV